MGTMTLDKAIDAASSLPYEQQEMLIEILRRRHIEMRRKEIGESIRQAKEDFKAGRLRARSAKEVIAELHHSLEIVE